VEYDAPPNKQVSAFQQRQPQDERNRRGGQFWKNWLPAAGRLVKEASTFFEAQLPAAPPEAPRFEDMSQGAVSLTWNAPPRQETSPEPLGYMIEWQRLTKVDEPLKALYRRCQVAHDVDGGASQ